MAMAKTRNVTAEIGSVGQRDGRGVKASRSFQLHNGKSALQERHELGCPEHHF